MSGNPDTGLFFVRGARMWESSSLHAGNLGSPGWGNDEENETQVTTLLENKGSQDLVSNVL